MLKNQHKTFWISLGLIIIACLSTWIMIKGHRIDTTAQKNLSHKPDAYMYQATYWQYNEAGYLHSRLNAKKTTHFPYENSSTLVAPDFLIYSKDRLPWYIRSQEGYTKNGIDFIHLANQVKLYQPASVSHPSTTIHTTQADVYPKESIAKTAAKVTIIRPGTKVTATGMRADFKNDVVKLLSHSKGFYDETIANPTTKDQN